MASLLVESAFQLHNFCIDERETKPINVGHQDPWDITPNYAEYLDSLGDGGTRCIRGLFYDNLNLMVTEDHHITFNVDHQNIAID